MYNENGFQPEHIFKKIFLIVYNLNTTFGNDHVKHVYYYFPIRKPRTKESVLLILQNSCQIFATLLKQ